jgi:drug/metabolite transporter (DMT)-like permease
MSYIVHQALALLCNVASGIGVVLANKAVFSTARFKYPVLLTALHYATNFILLVALARGGMMKWRSADGASSAIHGTTLVWALHNALSNLSLSRNSVGLYQISKIMVTPLICTIEFVLYGKLPPQRQALALLGACVGVALATVSDVQVTMLGASTAMASACASATLKVLQQDVLQRLRWSSLELMYRTWGAQLVLLLVGLPLLEPSWMQATGYAWTAGGAAVVSLSCLAAFALNVSSLVAIKLTSAIAIVLLGQTKTVLTLLGGVLLFDAAPSPRMVAGATLAVVSIAAYTYEGVQRPSDGRSDRGGSAGGHDGTALEATADATSEIEPLRR